MIADQYYTAPISLHSSDTSTTRGDNTDMDNLQHIEDGTEDNTASIASYADNSNIPKIYLTLVEPEPGRTLAEPEQSRCDDQQATVTDEDSVDSYGYLKPKDTLK